MNLSNPKRGRIPWVAPMSSVAIYILPLRMVYWWHVKSVLPLKIGKTAYKHEKKWYFTSVTSETETVTVCDEMNCLMQWR